MPFSFGCIRGLDDGEVIAVSHKPALKREGGTSRYDVYCVPFSLLLPLRLPPSCWSFCFSSCLYEAEDVLPISF